jgi:hypothetical protein
VVDFFISQQMLEVWTEEGKAEMTQNQIRLNDRGLSKKIEPAVHIVAVVSGDDRAKHLGTVRTEKEIAQLHGELYHSSLLIDDEAYTVDPGFMVTF